MAFEEPLKQLRERTARALAMGGPEKLAKRKAEGHLNARERIDYLVETLKSYRDSPRPGADTAMSAAIVGASDADIAALAHYAASL